MHWQDGTLHISGFEIDRVAHFEHPEDAHLWTVLGRTKNGWATWIYNAAFDQLALGNYFYNRVEAVNDFDRRVKAVALSQ